MTNISGSVLRAVADWYDTQHGMDVLVSRLRDDAAIVEMDEERVNRLAEVFREAGAIEGALGFDVGRGIRAVLESLDAQEGSESAEPGPRQWDCIEDVPVAAKVVDLKGRKWRHFAEGWMVWTRDEWMLPWHENRNNFAPFTEVVDGAR